MEKIRLPIYTDKRNGRLFVQFDYKGQTFKQYLPDGSRLTDAQKLETKMRHDAFFQANGMVPRNEVVFDDAVQEYLAHISHNAGKYAKAEYVLIAAKPFLKNKLLRSIKPIDIERFVFCRTAEPTMHGTGRAPATVWREVSVLSALFTFCIKNEYLEVNPCGKVEKPSFDNVQDTLLERKDESDFLAAFDPLQGEMARDICVLVLNTGLRQKDVLKLTRFDLRQRLEHIRTLQGKTQRKVDIPLNHTAQAIIAKYTTGNGLLFPSPKTGKVMRSIRTAIAGACRRVNDARKKTETAPMNVIGIQDLRRTFGTRLAEQGVDAMTIARLLGHADLRMVMRYARHIESMKKAVEILDKPTPSLPANIAQIR